MKKYDFRQEIMFHMYENDMDEFCSNVVKYYNNELNIDLFCIGIKNKEIKFNFETDNVILNLEFTYDDSLFEHCYRFDGLYNCNIYKGSRNIINKLYWFIYKNSVIITKKEPLYCNDCKKQIGWIVNDELCCAGFDYSISGFSSIKEYEKSLLEAGNVVECIECGEFYCDDCANINYEYESYSNFVCENCSDDEFDEEYYCDEDLIEKWGNCKFDEDDEHKPDSCEDCEYYENCLLEAEDNSDGYSSFCDCIVGHGYDSMDDFWECNGI